MDALKFAFENDKFVAAICAGPTVLADLGITAGIMVYISLDELLPTSERYGHHHLSIIGVVAGMAFMAFSLIVIG